ncbi:uncharacterized protein PHACADRAFT_86507, partial [Phanerochaete carnosa HHB-10118-sp]
MEDVICNERSRAVARRTITRSDLAKWPYIATNDAGLLDDGHAFIGTTEAKARSVKLKHLVFAGSHYPSKYLRRYTLSVDGKLLAGSFNASDILVWRLSDGLLVQRLQHRGHTDNVRSLSFSPNNQTLVSGSNDKNAIVWDVRSGHVLLRLEGHSGRVTIVTYAPHGALIVTASEEDNSMKIWD